MSEVTIVAVEDAPDWIAGDPGALRAWRETRPEALAPVMPDGVSESVAPARGAFRGGLLFRPEGALAGEAVLHFHGGGFVVGSPATHRAAAAWLAAALRRPVLSARYRLAPEHPVPAQAEDAEAAIHHALEHLAPRLILSGDSAGAMVALWGSHRLDPARRAALRSCVMFYGVFGAKPDPAVDAPEQEALGLGPRAIASMYARVDPEGWIGERLALTPLAPGFQTPERVLVVGASEDPVFADSLRLVEARPDVCELYVAYGLGHSFLSAPALVDDVVRKVLPDIAAWA